MRRGPREETSSEAQQRYKPYTAYKDSGVEWLGEIPAHWVALALKRVVDPARPVTYGIVQCGPDYPDGIPYIRPVDMTDEDGVDPSTLQRTAPDIAATYARSTVREGDIVVSIGPSFGKAMIVPSGLDGVNLTQGTARVAPKRNLMSRFLFWSLRSDSSWMAWDSYCSGATFRALTLEILETCGLALPPPSEQHAIAAFLDRETARIDALVAKKERLIELLQEKRTALITRAVTKGLDPTVPMKNSGVEWLGEIPAHWEVKALKSLSSLQTGLTLGKSYEGQALEIRPYLRVANVQDGYFDLVDVAEVQLPLRDAARYELRAGDVLMTEGGDFDKLGRGYVWEGQIAHCLHQNHIFAVRPRPQFLSPHYLALTMSSGYGRAYFTATSKQSTNLASTNSTKLRNLPMPTPDVGEQRAIVGFQDRETARIDALIAKVRDAIERLHELRTALISAAVTGKIDVRERVSA